MIVSIQILLGLVIGGAGFLQIAESPISGCSALLVGGFLIMAGIEQWFQVPR